MRNGSRTKSLLARLAKSVIQFTPPFIFLVAFVSITTAQNSPLVIAFAAPEIVTTCPPGSATNFCNFVNYELPYVSGIGVKVPWGSIDTCYMQAGGTQQPCLSTEPPTTDCPRTSPDNYYYFCALDTLLEAYITVFNSQPQLADKKIVLILNGITDGTPNNNNYTPDYVFTTAWANGIPGGCTSGCPPQDVVVCSTWKGNITNSPPSCPVSGTVNPGSYAVWNALGDSSPFLTNCNTYGASGLSCATASCGGAQSLGGFPIPYEQPFMAAYQAFVRAIAQHYNTTTGKGGGALIAPYIAYVRVGMAEGGENQPICAATGYIPQSSRGSTVQAGYVVGPNSGTGTLYVATGAGTTASGAMPTCSTAGCTTAPDGAMPGWYNVGSYGPVGSGNAIWPGPTGLRADPEGYWDDGYLTVWPPSSISAGTPGYITAMVTFLKSLRASFPFDISAHDGPPSNGSAPANVSYADSEAIVASANGVGFGMEAVSIGDAQAFATRAFPTSNTDWVHNFKTYAAPVHHLQMYNPVVGSYTYPANQYFAPGYSVYNIAVDVTGIATINCGTALALVDCTPFSSEPVYVVGNSNPALNGIWATGTACSPCVCSASALQFCAPFTPTSTQYYGDGTVWAPDYWPMVMPFAVQHNATTLEVNQCDLDYTFGIFNLGAGTPPKYPTTTWVTSESAGPGCAAWGVQQPTTSGYVQSAANTQIGQPAATSILVGNSSVTNGTQF
jgi:hypothetical protein